MSLAVLLWLALFQLLPAPSLHRDGAGHELGAPAASWHGSEAASPGSWAHRPGSTRSLRGTDAAHTYAALPAGTISVPWAGVRTDLRTTDPRADLASPSWHPGGLVPRVAGSDLAGRLASHAVEAHGGRLAYFPTAPPLHG